jgi:hypothetical protein
MKDPLPRGRCPVCRRRLVLTPAGFMPAHWSHDYKDCSGEGQEPAS